MNCTAPSTPLFDRIVHEVENGQAMGAAYRLAGILDAAWESDGDLSSWQAALTEHPLGRMMGLASNNKYAGGVLADAAQSFGFRQAMALHRTMALGTIERMAALGQTTCVLDGIAGHDAANLPQCGEVAIAGLDGWDAQSRFLCECQTQGQYFDAIIALDIVSAARPIELASRIAAIADRLAPAGRLFTRSFLSGHLGTGWRMLCDPQPGHAHDECALAAAADTAGLTISQFRDASDSLVWAVLRRTSTHV